MFHGAEVKDMNRTQGQRSEQGFTLIEIAIVMVIIGLLLGGVLKGQEMIKNARAHNVNNQLNGLKAAIIAFQDRYRALPGDYSRAVANIPNVLAASNGNGNGRVLTNTTANDEVSWAWNHLAASGFISGDYNGTAIAAADLTTWTCTEATCPQNAFGGGLFFIYANQQGTNLLVPGNANSNQLWSGRSLPVDLLAEVDRKVDDGHAGKGTFQIGDSFSSTGAAIVQCDAGGSWDIATQGQDCGAVILF